MKHFWPMALMFHSFVIMPAALTFLVYSVGAAVLLLQWELLLAGIGTFIIACAMFAFLGIISE